MRQTFPVKNVNKKCKFGGGRLFPIACCRIIELYVFGFFAGDLQEFLKEYMSSNAERGKVCYGRCFIANKMKCQMCISFVCSHVIPTVCADLINLRAHQTSYIHAMYLVNTQTLK